MPDYHEQALLAQIADGKRRGDTEWVEYNRERLAKWRLYWKPRVSGEGSNQT